MSDDIVEELREAARLEDEYPGTAELHTEAADCIERLRAELAAERVWHKEARKALKLTRKALEPFVDLRRARDAIAAVDAVLKETGAGMSDMSAAQIAQHFSELAAERKRIEKLSQENALLRCDAAAERERFEKISQANTVLRGNAVAERKRVAKLREALEKTSKELKYALTACKYGNPAGIIEITIASIDAVLDETGGDGGS
jgi:alanyl-tRNA synthetase